MSYPGLRKTVAAIAIAAIAGTADAAQRTFVASYGSDANNCSLGAPCRSFGTAIGETDAGGEIVVLDSAGYGRVTITKSVSIVAPAGIHAGISVGAGASGVLIFNASAVVVLRGLAISGQPGSTYGVYLNQGARLYVEQCTISNMGSGGLILRDGHTYVSDSTIRDNGTYGIRARDSIGLVIDRTRIERNGLSGVSAGNGTRATITGSVIAGNLGDGVDIGTDNLSDTLVSIADSSVSQNGSHGVHAQTHDYWSVVRLTLTRSTLSENALTAVTMRAETGWLGAALTDNTIARNRGGAGGVVADGAGVRATIDRNTIAFNAPDGVVQLSGALLRTRANNTIRDNLMNDTAGNLTPAGGD